MAHLLKRKEIIILWTGVFIIVVMCLFPPRIYGRKMVGYAFLFSDTISVFDQKSFDGSNMYKTVNANIDLVHLIIQCVIVALITGALFYTLKDKKSEGSGKTVEAQNESTPKTNK